MANVNGIDIQAFLKKVNQGGKANIGEAVKLFTEPNVVNSLFSNSDAAISIEKIATSDLWNIAHTSLNNVVMKDDNAELSENELNCAIQDIEEKIVKYAKKLESQERQEMGLTQDIDKVKNVKTEEAETTESAPASEKYGDAEKDVPENVRNAVDETVENLAEGLVNDSYAETKCNADGATIKKVHKKDLFKTNGAISGFVGISSETNKGLQVKHADAIQVFVEYEYKGKIYTSKTVEKECKIINSSTKFSSIDFVEDEPEFE